MMMVVEARRSNVDSFHISVVLLYTFYNLKKNIKESQFRLEIYAVSPISEIHDMKKD
jgi:hypothetical protein